MCIHCIFNGSISHQYDTMFPNNLGKNLRINQTYRLSLWVSFKKCYFCMWTFNITCTGRKWRQWISYYHRQKILFSITITPILIEYSGLEEMYICWVASVTGKQKTGLPNEAVFPFFLPMITCWTMEKWDTKFSHRFLFLVNSSISL